MHRVRKIGISGMGVRYDAKEEQHKGCSTHMGLITFSGQPGCRHEEIARLTSQLLRFELITEGKLQSLLEREFGPEALPDKAFAPAALSILAHLATEHHMVVTAVGSELVLKDFPGLLRIRVVAQQSRRIGVLMLESRIERPAATEVLRSVEAEQKAMRKKRFGRITAPPESFDLMINTESIMPEQAAEIAAGAAAQFGVVEQGKLSPAAEARIEFQVRLKLSKHGIAPPGRASLARPPFMHPSEEIFANLLDFYRIAWDYEPRSFPIQWTRDGKVLEAFTPDFYLPEFDLYVELTTMKQSLVTKKNRKVKLLRQMYPQVNIQVFYQKDFENLIFKHGLAERLTDA